MCYVFVVRKHAVFCLKIARFYKVLCFVDYVAFTFLCILQECGSSFNFARGTSCYIEQNFLGYGR